MLDLVSPNEDDRLAALHRYDVLDTPAEESFDRITRVAKSALQIPIVLVSLVDAERQWFKSKQGLDAVETPRNISFCTHAINQNEPMLVRDALDDERFRENPLVTGELGIRFYLGIPLRTPDGFNIGTLCAIDQKPRDLSSIEIDLLRDLACVVVDELELRLIAEELTQSEAEEREAKELLKKANQQLSERYETAHQFVDNVSHEFRTPLAVIKEFSSILADGLAGEVNSDQKEYLGIVINRVDDLAVMVDDMLDISKLEAGLLGVVRQETSPDAIFEDVRTTLERKAAANDATLTIAIDPALPFVYCDAQKIARVIINLAVNAFKFSGEGGEVSVWASHEPENSQIIVGVTDNGPGIAPENVQTIFDRFKQVGGDIRASTKGFGLGLNIVRELVHLNFGDIALESGLGIGSTFTFTIPEFDPPKIVERFMARINRSRTGSSSISLITARMDPVASIALATDVEEFLQYRLRRGDVLFGVEPGRWLLGSVIGEEPVEKLLDSLEEAWTDANRDRRDAPLPAIDFEINGIWPIRGDHNEFIDRFKAEFNAGQGNIGERGQPSDMGTAA